jgi:hypothetical protein
MRSPEELRKAILEWSRPRSLADALQIIGAVVATAWFVFTTDFGPWRPILPLLALAFFCFAIWAISLVRSLLFSASPSAQAAQESTPLPTPSAEPTNKAPVLVACYVSKRGHERTDTETGPRGNFHVLKCRVHNTSDKTVSNIVMTLACRSLHRGNVLGALVRNTGPEEIVFDRQLSLNPHGSIEFVFFSQKEDDPANIYLGDHKDEDATRIEGITRGEATHFITLAIGATDMIPTYKNFVAITLNPSRLIALEHDSRRWGHHQFSPSPYVSADVPVH